MLKNLFNNQKGSTLMLITILSFVIISITMTMILFAGTSAKQSFGEENKTQAYYIAKTGAESLIKHLEDMSSKDGDVKKELDELKDEGIGKGSYDDGEFTLEITELTEDKYEIKSTGKVNETEDWIIAELTIGETTGGGYNTGDGKIFVNSSKQIDIEKVPQLEGAGLVIHHKSQKYGSSVPILINEPGNISKLFKRLNDKSDVTLVKTLNAQKESGYKLEIKEPTNEESNISKENPIRIEKLVKYKDIKKDSSFEELEFRYGTTKKDVLNYFSKEKLGESMLTNSQIQNGLKDTFLLPITTIEDYKNYMNEESPIYPNSPKYDSLKNGTNKGKIEETKKKDKPVIGGFKNSTDYTINEIILNNGVNFVIDTKGDTNIKIDVKIEISKNDQITIKADDKVNIYLKGEAQINGDIIVEGDGEVNLYMYGEVFQANNGSVIKNINLYGPTSEIKLNKIDYTGIIVGKIVDFDNEDSTFRAPTSGTASADDVKTQGMTIEWKR